MDANVITWPYWHDDGLLGQCRMTDGFRIASLAWPDCCAGDSRWYVSGSAAHRMQDGRRWHLRALEQSELQRYRSIGNGEYVDGGCQLGVEGFACFGGLGVLALDQANVRVAAKHQGRT